MVKPLLENSLAIPQNLNIEFLYNPAIPLLGISPRKSKIYTHAKICSRIFKIALFRIAKIVKIAQMSNNWGMDKQNMVYLYSRIWSGHKKGMKFWYMLQCKWTLKSMLSERMHYCMVPFMWTVQNR